MFPSPTAPAPVVVMVVVVIAAVLIRFTAWYCKNALRLWREVASLRWCIRRALTTDGEIRSCTHVISVGFRNEISLS